jgi:hypothetical protein
MALVFMALDPLARPRSDEAGPMRSNGIMDAL